MLKRILVSSILLINACSLKVEPDAKTEEILKQHQIVLQAIMEYVQQLQASGVLPKVEELEGNKTK